MAITAILDEERAGLARRASRAVFWNLILVPSLGALSLLSSALVARALTTDAYRLYGLAVATITSLLLWSDLGISAAVSRFTPELRRADGGSALSFLRNAAALKLGALVLVVLGIVVAKKLGASEEILPFDGLALTLVVSVTVFQSLARVSQYFLTGLLERKAVGTIHLTVGIVQSLLVILAALGGYGLQGVLVAMASSAVFELFLSRARASRELVSRRETEDAADVPASLSRRARHFAGISFADKVASYFSGTAFVIFLVAAFGAREEVVVFAIAGEFAMRMVGLLSIPFTGITLPLFSTIDAEAGARGSATALRLYLILLLLLYVPTGALLTSLSHLLLPLVYSEKYIDALPILTLMIPFFFLEHCLQPPISAALMTQRKYRLVLASRIPMVLSVPMVILVVPTFGAVGAAAVMGLARLLSAGLLLLLGFKELRFRYPVSYALKVAVAAASAVFLVRFLGATAEVSWTNLFELGVLGSVIFFLVYKGLGGIGQADRGTILTAAPELERFFRYVL